MITRRVTYRLYPSQQQEQTLHYWRKMHCALYNAAVYNRKTQYQKFGHSVNYLEQHNCLPAFKEVWTEYKPLGSHALQARLKRVDFAFTRFFKGLGGDPKFKASRHYSGWTYPCKAGWKAHTTGDNGSLELSNLGNIAMRGKARTWGTPTTCTLLCRNGKWYASITVQCEPVRVTGDGAVGIDLGCKDAITLSTGEKIAKPDFIKQGQQKVKVASKKLRRKRAPNRNTRGATTEGTSATHPLKKIKASRRWRKARQQVSSLQRQVARQRENWLHQTTSNILSGNSLVAGEQLNVKGMTRRGKKQKRQKAGLNRSILDVGFSTIANLLAYKQAEAGGFYVESPTKTLQPTQRCAKCWELTPKTLSHRVHICSNPTCRHTEDRDINAAQVNLIWASGKLRARVPRVEQTFQDRGHELSSSVVESPSSTACGSMRQLGARAFRGKLPPKTSLAKKPQKQLLANTEIGNSDLSASGSE